MSPRLPEPLPHGYPFRLVEWAERAEDGKVAVVLATANGALTGSQPWPVTLVAEALAQAVLLLAPPRSSSAPRLVGINAVDALQPIAAGDRLEVDVSLTATFGSLRRYTCRAVSGGALAAVAQITVAEDVAAEG